MYTLRTIDKGTGVENNYSLGSRYRVYNKDRSPKAFTEIISAYDIPENPAPDAVRLLAFIEAELGSLFHFYDDQYAYIMTESGNTFAKL
jgi:hypothetical protein